jgi:hypothetical protein
MNTGRVASILCALTSLPNIGLAGPADSNEKALKTAESKLACCLEAASKSFIKDRRKDADVRLKQSQANWEKYREVEIDFEMGDIKPTEKEGKDWSDGIRLRLTNERIDAIQRLFEYTLCNPSEVRVRNETGADINNIVVGDKKYGDLRLNDSTKYQHWEVAYEYAFVSLTADSKTLEIRPIDFFGERPLGEGKFTYVLTISRDGRLEMRAEKDEP